MAQSDESPASDKPAPLRTFPPGAPRPGRPAGMTEEALAERRAAFLAELPDDPPPDARNKRLRPMQQDEVRAKIQSDRLVRQLQLNTLGLLTDIEGNPREMTPGQIKSAEVLLSKSLSTLSATEIVSVNANDRMTESEILGKIAELLQADPRLVRLVGAGVAAPPVLDDAGCIVCGGAGLPDGCGACGTVSDGAA